MVKIVLTCLVLVLFLNHINCKDEPGKISKAERDSQHFALKFLFMFGSMLLVGVIRHLVREFNIPVPYHFFCILAGILWGIAAQYNTWMSRMSRVSATMMQALTYIYLPVIIFTMSFGIDVHSFIKSLPQILVLSIPAAFVSIIINGIMMKLVIDLTWTTADALLFGSILVSIYPKEVLRILTENSVQSKHAKVLLEGETLITASWSLFVFRFIVNYSNGWVVHWYQVVMGVARLLFMGIPMSYLYGIFGRSLMQLAYNDTVGLMIITVGMCYTAYCFVQWSAKAGILGTLTVGIVMGLEKTSLPQEVQMSLVNLWKAVVCIINGLLFVNVGAMAPKSLKDLEFQDGITVLVTYLVTNMARFITFFLFSPILSRIGYGMSFGNMILCVWSGLKNPYALNMAMSLARTVFRNQKHKAQIFFLHTLGVFMLMTLINGSCVPVLVRALGLTDISIARRINMNNCIKYINEAKSRAVSILKMDRFLADANWPLVMNSTSLRHPYQEKTHDTHQTEAEEDTHLSNKFTYCPDCQRNVPNEPTAKELKEMAREAKLRLLKLKKTAYTRQFENGMVSMYGIRILHQAVEIASDSNDLVIELDGLFKLFARQGIFYRFLRNRLTNFLERRGEWCKPPRKQRRRWCYRIINHDAFVFFMCAMVLTNMIIIASHLTYFLRVDGTLGAVRLAIRFFYCVIYLIEFVLKIFAFSWIYICKHGFRTYFRSYWCWLEFIILLLSFLVIAFHITVTFFVSYRKYAYTDIILIVLLGIRFLQVFHFLTYFAFCKTLVPSLIKYLDTKIHRHRTLAFELAKNYLAGEEEILENLHQIVDNDIIREEIKTKIERDKLELLRIFGLAQKESPSIATTVKTKLAMRMVLNSMKEDVKSLKVSGWVDDVEFGKLLKSVSERSNVINYIKTIPPPSSKFIMMDVPYMGDDKQIMEFLYSNVVSKKYDPGDTVFKEGDVADFICILITGMLSVHYSPNPEVLDKMRDVGALPIVDHVCSLTYEEEMKDYILPGNTVGELSLLTARPYNSTVRSETHSQVFTVSRAILETASVIKYDPVNGLECRMWKYLSFKKALTVMMNIPHYRSLTHEQMKYLLERSFVPNLSNYKIFVVTTMMSDLILIEGVAVDFNSRDMYTGPCYIPRAVQKLVMPKSSYIDIEVPIETKLLIIPAKDFDQYEIMVTEEDTCELVNDDSKLCLRHLIRERGLLSGKTELEKHLQINRKVSASRKRTKSSEISFKISSIGSQKMMMGTPTKVGSRQTR